MHASAFRKNLSLVLCCYCVAIIAVVVLTAWPAFVDGIVIVLFLSAPLLIPVLISFLLHTKLAHWFNTWPALLYVALIVLMRFAIEGAFVIAYFLFQIGPSLRLPSSEAGRPHGHTGSHVNFRLSEPGTERDGTEAWFFTSDGAAVWG
ncbi:MAG: hypothetical protein EOP87_21845, partial [Verrucomicrobiaceae bacterium]